MHPNWNPNYVPKQEYDDSYQMYKMVKREDTAVKAEETQQFFFPPRLVLDPMTVPWGTYPQRFSPFFFNFLQYPSLTPTPYPITQLPIQKPQLMPQLMPQSMMPQAKPKPKPPMKKPFKILRETKKSEAAQQSISVKVEDQIQIKVETASKAKKKKYRTNNCKNYVGLLCAGFSRTILTAKPDSEILNYIKKSIGKTKLKFDTLTSYEDEVLIDSLTKYIYKVMCGKKVRKANRERDFKIRNTKDLQSLLNIAPKDNELLCLKKEVLRDMMEYFFNSDYYNQWLSNGMMTGPNRLFFLNNKEEIQKKVLNPGFYKPRFNNQS